MHAFLFAFHTLPLGTYKGTSHGKRYVVSKSSFNGGKSWKLVAEELGGPDYISMNMYDLASGPRLYPCEMTTDKVIDFVCGLMPEA